MQNIVFVLEILVADLMESNSCTILPVNHRLDLIYDQTATDVLCVAVDQWIPWIRGLSMDEFTHWRGPRLSRRECVIYR